MIKKEETVTLDISKEIKAVEDLSFSSKLVSVGKVKAIFDGVALITGLNGGMIGEHVEFANGAIGMILNLKEGEVGVAVFGDYSKIEYGSEVKGSGQVLSVLASYGLLGRIVNPLIEPIDGKGKILVKGKESMLMPVEKVAAGVIERQDVRTPLQTGIKDIDALVPVGRGQRELIIGDRGVCRNRAHHHIARVLAVAKTRRFPRRLRDCPSWSTRRRHTVYPPLDHWHKPGRRQISRRELHRVQQHANLPVLAANDGRRGDLRMQTRTSVSFLPTYFCRSFCGLSKSYS